ncbi:MAG: hypothetical protein ACE5EN_05995 [Nitrospinota bacterium]
MKKTSNVKKKTRMLKEYDFSGGRRGKYTARYAKGSNIVMLENDVLDVFPNGEAAKRALKALAKIIRSQLKPKVK